MERRIERESDYNRIPTYNFPLPRKDKTSEFIQDAVNVMTPTPLFLHNVALKVKP